MTGFFQSMIVLAAEAGGAAGQAAQNGGQQQTFTDALIGIAPIILIVIVFFWLMNRSQKKKQQERQEMLDSIRPKDDVVTIGGIKGRVVRIEDDEIVLRIDPEKDIKVTMARTGIARRQGQEADEA